LFYLLIPISIELQDIDYCLVIIFLKLVRLEQTLI